MTAPVTIGAEGMASADRLVRVIDALADAFGDLSAGRTRSPSRTIVEHGPERQLLVGPAGLGAARDGQRQDHHAHPGQPGPVGCRCSTAWSY